MEVLYQLSYSPVLGALISLALLCHNTPRYFGELVGSGTTPHTAASKP